MFDIDESLLGILFYLDGLDIHDIGWKLCPPTTESKSIVVGLHNPPTEDNIISRLFYKHGRYSWEVPIITERASHPGYLAQ